MAKSTQHVDKIGSYEDFRAPWETESGEETEPNKGTLKRLLYNVRLDLAKSKDAAEDLKAEVAEKQTEVDTAKQEAADAAGGDAQKTIDKLTRERDDALAKVSEFEERDSIAELRKEVLGDFAEKNPKAAALVTGKTQEELEASLESVKDALGITDSGDEEEEEEEEIPEVRNTPRTRVLRNPGDSANGKAGDAEIDFDKVANDYIAGGSVFG